MDVGGPLFTLALILNLILRSDQGKGVSNSDLLCSLQAS
jgi:hypothetical protein